MKLEYRKCQSCFMEYEPCTCEPSSYCTFIKYAPHGKQHPKIVQRYRIRFISTGYLPLPMSFVSMIIQIVRRCSSACGIFPLQRWCKPNAMKLASIAEVQPILSKVSASGILQGSALHAVSQIIFQQNGVQSLLFHFPKPQGWKFIWLSLALRCLFLALLLAV